MAAATQSQQQLMEGVGVEGGTGVEMMVMDSLDPTLLQMKTEVSYSYIILRYFSGFNSYLNLEEKFKYYVLMSL